MNFPVIEMFYSIQGEGKYMGVPTFFVRVSGCNLRCVFKDSCCDTPYSSFDPEKSPYKTIDDVVDAFEKMYNEHPNTHKICITGGEPMLYQRGIIDFMNALSDRIPQTYFTVTIETNGTLNIDKLCEEMDSGGSSWEVELLSVSPKLSTSVDKVGKISEEMRKMHDTNRINIPNLLKYITVPGFTETQLKFVYSGPECIDEIMDILNRLAELMGAEKEDLFDMVYLMPEGITVDQMNSAHKECVEQCLKYGWKFAPRLHIMVWGDKRGV